MLQNFSSIQARLNLGGPGWTRVYPDEPGWTRMNPGEPGWTRLNPGEPGWTRLNPVEPGTLGLIMWVRSTLKTDLVLAWTHCHALAHMLTGISA
jgi:hypothetical protein